MSGPTPKSINRPHLSNSNSLESNFTALASGPQIPNDSLSSFMDYSNFIFSFLVPLMAHHYCQRQPVLFPLVVIIGAEMPLYRWGSLDTYGQFLSSTCSCNGPSFKTQPAHIARRQAPPPWIVTGLDFTPIRGVPHWIDHMRGCLPFIHVIGK